ncbi:MAG: ATP-binding protein [Acidobacteriota bacterium]
MLKKYFSSLKISPLFIFVNIILFFAVFYFAGLNAERKTLELKEDAIESIKSDVNKLIEKKQDIIRSISGINILRDVSNNLISSESREFLTVLETIKRTINASVVYLMNSDGLVIGSSTYAELKTLKGNRAGFRPYFLNAMKGRNSFYAAVGVTTGKRGLYFAFPLYGNNVITGVIVIKFDLIEVDRIFRRFHIPSGLLSPDGIVFAGNNREWFYKTVFPLSDEKISDINSSRQFGNRIITRMLFNFSEPDIRIDKTNYNILLRDLSLKGWKIYTLNNSAVKFSFFIPFQIFLLLFLMETLIIYSLESYKAKKSTENHIRESRERFKYLFESAMDSIYILDGDGSIIDVNQMALVHFGYSWDEIVGKKFRDLFHEESLNLFTRHFKVLSKELNTRFEFKGCRKDGKMIYIDCSAVLLRDRGGEKNSYFVFLKDITKRKESEILLKKAKEEAEKANTSKSEFLANVSHEIRTPMNAILGFSEMLENTKLNKDQKEYIEVIKESGESLLYIIDEILDFSKIEAGKFQFDKSNFDLWKIISEVMKVIKVRISDDKIRLIKSIEGSVPRYLFGDIVRIKQILLNLLSNAVKFTKEGEIRLSVRLWKELGNWVSVRFEISDTGIGISPDDKDKLFKSFSQIDTSASRRYEGAGLGLSITSKFIEMMGGEIKVKSKIGEGSVFYFTINFEKGESEDEKTGIGKDIIKKMKKDELSKYSILIAEDNKVNSMLLEYILKREGFEITIVANGKQAVDQVKKKKFDIILMDIQMPELDGVEATKIISGFLTEKPPIIALTANAMKGDRDKYIAAGMDDYLSKPFKREILVNTIIKWILETRG